MTGDLRRGGGGGLYYADRTRNQLQVVADQVRGEVRPHAFKFGAEIERSDVRTQYQPYGPAGFYIYAYGGVPSYRVTYGYDVQGDNHRTSAYAQDQWSAGRVTLNIGLRLDHIRGHSPVLDEDVYTPKTAWGPRVGVAYDLTGNGTMAVKAFWGATSRGRRAPSSRPPRRGCRTSPDADPRRRLAWGAGGAHSGHRLWYQPTSSTRGRTSSTCRSKRS